MIIPVVITVYADHSFSFICKTPPAAVLLKKAAGLDSASGEPNKTKVATLTRAQAEEIAKTKMPDLNAADLDAATEMIKGTARSMGIEVVPITFDQVSDPRGFDALTTLVAKRSGRKLMPKTEGLQRRELDLRRNVLIDWDTLGE